MFRHHVHSHIGIKLSFGFIKLSFKLCIKHVQKLKWKTIVFVSCVSYMYRVYVSNALPTVEVQWCYMHATHTFMILSLLFKNINFRQNTAIWTQPMLTHNLTQAHDMGSYTRLIQSQISLASNPCRPGKCSTLVWTADTVLLHKAWFYFV